MEGSCIDLVLTAGVRTEEISLLEEKKKTKKPLNPPRNPRKIVQQYQELLRYTSVTKPRKQRRVIRFRGFLD